MKNQTKERAVVIVIIVSMGAISWQGRFCAWWGFRAWLLFLTLYIEGMNKYLCLYKIRNHEKEYSCEFFADEENKQIAAFHAIIFDNDEKFGRREIKIVSILDAWQRRKINR